MANAALERNRSKVGAKVSDSQVAVWSHSGG
jgi:hypothetical protein